MEDIYDSEVWKNLEKNPLFVKKYNKIIKDCSFYTNEEDIDTKIDGNKLVISYISNIHDRDLNCQFKKISNYQIFTDQDNNLIIDEECGILRSNYGFDYDESIGGVLDTHYSYEMYDMDGVELLLASYSDTYNLSKEVYDANKDDFSSLIKGDYNPNLDSHSLYYHPSVIGKNSNYIRYMREKSNLGLVTISKCEFNPQGYAINIKEDYYFNTFLSSKIFANPERICVIREYPFASIDENNKMHFNELYAKSGLNYNNYQKVANDRFLKELLNEKLVNEKHVSKEILDKYDLMIQKVNDISKNYERTR